VSLTMAFDGWVQPQDDCPFYPTVLEAVEEAQRQQLGMWNNQD
jgi:hypothetical protein